MAILPKIFQTGGDSLGDFSAVPDGDYTAQLFKSTMKDTKAQDGSQFLECFWKLLAPADYAGKVIVARLNLVNANATTVEIAYKHLESICKAVGYAGQVTDSSVLHGKPCIIKVVKTEATSKFPEGNDIKNYTALSGSAPAQALNAPTVPTVPTVPAAPTQASDDPAVNPNAEAPPIAKPPWMQ